MTLREEMFKSCHEWLEYYQDKSVSDQKKKEYYKLLLRCKMDYESLFQFGNGNRLMTLHVKPTWGESFLYQVYETQQGKLWLYWKKGQVCDKIYEKIKNMSLSEFQNKPDLHSEMNELFPPEKRRLSEKQAQTVRNLYYHKLKENAEEIYGFDGTDFYLRIYSEPAADYEGWSHMPEEWNLFAELTKIVAEVSELGDKRFYAAHTVFHN